MVKEKEQKKAPIMRFKGFTDDWEQRKLGNHAKIKGRLGWKSLKQEEYILEGPNMIAGRHIVDGVIQWDKVDHIPKWRYDESPEIMLENDDVIFSKDGTLGNPALIKDLTDPATINSTMMLVRTDESISSKFFYQVLKSNLFERLIYLKVSGSSIPHLFQSDMKDFTFSLPSIEEQVKIGTFFKQLDDIITLHQRKLDLLKSMKQAFLQEMFPKKGVGVPRVRFANFSDVWEQCKVFEITKKTYGGGTPKTNIKAFWDGNIPWIQSSDLEINKLFDIFPKKKITKEAVQKSATKIIPSNSIAIVTRVGVGKLAFMPFKYATSQDFLSLSELQVDPYFGMYSLYSLLQKERNNIQGTSIKGMTKSDLLEKKLVVSGEAREQQKIGKFFKQLDDTITLHQEKISNLENMKKSFLGNLFV